MDSITSPISSPTHKPANANGTKKRQSQSMNPLRKTRSAGEALLNKNKKGSGSRPEIIQTNHNDDEKGGQTMDPTKIINPIINQLSMKEMTPKQIFIALNQMKVNMYSAKKVIDTICDKFDKLDENDMLTPRTVSTGSGSSRPTSARSKAGKDNFVFLLPQLMKAKRVGNEVIETQRQFRDSLQNWMNKITPKIIGHFKNWETWDSDDIVDWIMTIEAGRFGKYEQHLRQEMKKAELKGKHLRHLAQNITHLQRFGIINFDDETCLQNYLNRLINGQHQHYIMKSLISASNTPSSSRPRTPNHRNNRAKSPQPSSNITHSKSYNGYAFPPSMPDKHNAAATSTPLYSHATEHSPAPPLRSHGHNMINSPSPSPIASAHNPNTNLNIRQQSPSQQRAIHNRSPMSNFSQSEMTNHGMMPRPNQSQPTPQYNQNLHPMQQHQQRQQLQYQYQQQMQVPQQQTLSHAQQPQNSALPPPPDIGIIILVLLDVRAWPRAGGRDGDTLSMFCA